MSAQTRDGQRAPLPCDPDAFRSQLFDRWAGPDPAKHRKLAALQLHESLGWTYRQVGLAFDVTPQRAEQLCRECAAELRESFAPPERSERSSGFTDPDDRGVCSYTDRHDSPR